MVIVFGAGVLGRQRESGMGAGVLVGQARRGLRGANENERVALEP